MTFQVVYWIDIFSRKTYRDIIIDSLRYCQKEKELVIWAYVIMTNHIHLIASGNNEDLSDIVRDFKKFTSKEIVKTIESGNESRKKWILELLKKASERHKRNTTYQLWTHENHAVEIVSPTFFHQKKRYIHLNPVRSGLVEKPQEWIYSSARNYCGLDAILEVQLID